MKKKLEKQYPTDYNLLIAQDLWQVECQILSVTFLKEFIKLYVNTETVIKNVKLAELNMNTAPIFLNAKI